jgi:hypothetical protein
MNDDTPMQRELPPEANRILTEHERRARLDGGRFGRSLLRKYARTAGKAQASGRRLRG